MATTVRAKRPTHTQSASTPDEVTSPIILQLRPVIDLTPDQLLELSSLNDDLPFELTAEGALSIMAPTGWDGGHQNAGITAQLWMWAEQEGSGATADSSTLFTLPNGAIRSPDAAWITNARLATVPTAQRRKPLPLCPDFVVELRSPTDRLPTLQAKMQEYIENGARLGWLIDPDPKHLYVYTPQQPVRRLDAPETVSGEPVLPGFTLDLRRVW